MSKVRFTKVTINMEYINEDGTTHNTGSCFQAKEGQELTVNFSIDNLLTKVVDAKGNILRLDPGSQFYHLTVRS